MCTDLPGMFPWRSNRGNGCVFILCDCDSNAIPAEPIKSRRADHLIQGYDACCKRLTDAGIKPVLHRLDNEVSNALISSIQAKDLDCQLVNTHMHRRNLAERAIQTFKAHFTSILNGTDTKFPPHIWCQLIPQTVLTLNLLRRSRINPKLDAHHQIFGLFDFNSTPPGPLGTKCVAHEPKERRKTTWSSRGRQGRCVGPAMHHHRQCNIHVPHTRSTIPAEKVIFPPTKFPMPETSSADKLNAAVDDLIHELKQKSHPATPFLEHGDPINNAVNKLQEFFQPQQQFETPTCVTTAPSPRVAEIPDSSPRVVEPRNLFGITQNILQGMDRRNIINNRTRSHNNQPAPFTKGCSKAIAFLAHKTDAYKLTQHCGFAVTHHITGKQMECKDSIKDPHCRDNWLRSCANELGNLAQGVGNRVKGTNAIFFVHKHQVSKGRTVTFP